MVSGRLIEYTIPHLIDINKEAAKEKLGNAKPPIFELTYWWTRKPLSVCRALILASVVPKDFNPELFGEIIALERQQIEKKERSKKDKTVSRKKKRAHNYNPEPEHLKLIREIINRDWGGELVLLDPFAGGGSIPFEALRLGIPAIAIEYNPVAWLLLKVLEWCQKYGDSLINVELFEKVIKKRYRRGFTIDTEELCKEPEEELKKYGDLVYWGCKILNKLKEELSQFYPDYNGRRVAAYIWVRQVRCPKCGAWIPLTLDWYLSEKRNIYFVPVYEGDDYRVEIKRQGETPPTTVIRGEGEARCPRCGYRISDKYVKEHVKGNDRLVVLVLEGKEYVVARDVDVKAVERAKQYLEQRPDLKQLAPDEEIVPNELRAVFVPIYGYTRFSDLFTPRQLLVLTSLVKVIREVREELLKQGYDLEYADALAGILALLVTKHADYNSALTTWHSLNEQVAHTFSFRGIVMTWQYVEVNPFAKFSGSIWNMYGDLLEAIAYAVEKLRDTPKFEVIFGSALHIPLLDKSVKLVITDPPYYDDVPYAELSDFFYVWLKRVLGDIFPEVFSFYTLWRDRSSEELSVGGYRDEKVFEANLITAFREIKRVLRDDGLLVLFFAHSSTEAWAKVLKMLLEAGFQVVATHPVRCESPESVVQRGKLAIESAITIVCRPRVAGGRVYVEELYPEIETAVREAVKKAWDAGYRGADLVIVAFGAALRVVTRYSEIKSRTGRSVMDLLDYVQSLVPKLVTELILNRSIETIDRYTAFYMYVRSVPEYWDPKTKTVRFSGDEFLKLAKGFQLDRSALVSRSLIKEIKVGTKKGYKVLTFREREIPPKPVFDSVIDVLHYLLQRFVEQGKKGVEAALSSMAFRNFRIEDIYDVAQAIAMSSIHEDEEVKIIKQFLQSFGKYVPNSSGRATIDMWF